VSAIVALSALIGLLIGSFLNVVIYRVPLKRSVVSPPSACPACGHRLAWFENIPVVSWMGLRGRCRHCGARISIRYPLVELATGVFFAGVSWALLSSSMGEVASVAAVVALAAFLYLAAISVALTAIDLESQTLPNVLVLPAYPVLILVLGASSLLSDDLEALFRGGIGMVILFAAYYLMAFVYPGGMGFGDVKLAGALGFAMAWLGWDVFAVGAFAPFLLGGVFAVALVLLTKAGRKTRVPFGPWMLLGAWVGIFAGSDIAAAYLNFVGLA
jgi:leader peptidase (prepilin peptidase)/N-methyltransferase